MPKEEWGVKRVCPTTGKRFYDLGRNPIVSPYTGEIVSLDTGPKSRVLIKDEKEKSRVVEDDVLIDDDSDDVLDGEADVDLDDDVLDEDADDDNVSFDDLAEVDSDDEDN